MVFFQEGAKHLICDTVCQAATQRQGDGSMSEWKIGDALSENFTEVAMHCM